MIKVRERRAGKSTRWQVDFHAPLGGDGPPRRWRLNAPAHVTSRSGAERWGRDQLGKVLRGETPRATREGRARAAAESVEQRRAAQDAEREAITVRAWVGEYLDDLRARRIRETTIATRRRQLAHFVEVAGDRGVAEVGDLDWQRLRRHLAGHAPSTASGILGIAVTALRAAHRVGLRGPVHKPEKIRPSAEIDSDAEPESYSFEEYRRLVSAAAGESDRHIGVVLLGGDAGLRVGEMAGLKVEDIDLRRGVIVVRRTIVVIDGRRVEHLPKSGRARKVPASARLLEVLGRLADDPVAGDGWLLHNAAGRPAVPSNIDRLVLTVQARAGLPSRGPHKLRHTFASHALEAGTTLEELRKLLGHSSIAITARYLHTTEGSVRAAIDRLAEHRANLADPSARIAPVTDLAQARARREASRKSE